MRTSTAGRVAGVALVAFCLLSGLISALSQQGLAEEPRKRREKKVEATQLPGQYVHVALYTFKSDAPEGTVAAFAADAKKCFGQIPEVRSFRIGLPAGQGTPKAWMVEPKGAFHVGAVISFDDFAGMAKYGNHPKHNELKQKYAKFFDKIVVYDFEG